ncbi:hypothetical protein PR048_005674 [Dryococelus australis]|uniref:Uncharacterized protein n=1 Tax=Dryococelus australis TaxID=614101 RepID=A0ABQ9I9T5_9NEOP|nr:hypothetical protein PR048_005674 [Dryococelus australis]
MEQCKYVRAGEIGDAREILRPTALSSKIPMCENPGATQSGIYPNSPRWEANSQLRNKCGHGVEKQDVFVDDILRGATSVSKAPALEGTYKDTEAGKQYCYFRTAVAPKSQLDGQSSKSESLLQHKFLYKSVSDISSLGLAGAIGDSKGRGDREGPDLDDQYDVMVSKEYCHESYCDSFIERLREVNMERCQNEGVGKWEIPEKTCIPTASSGTILPCENLVTQPGIEPGSPSWEASMLIAQPPWPHVVTWKKTYTDTRLRFSTLPHGEQKLILRLCEIAM